MGERERCTLWLILPTKKTAKQETTGGEVCTDSPVHKVTFTRTGKSGTCITLVVSHNVKNGHVYSKSKNWTVIKRITTVSKCHFSIKDIWRNILGVVAAAGYLLCSSSDISDVLMVVLAVYSFFFFLHFRTLACMYYCGLFCGLNKNVIKKSMNSSTASVLRCLLLSFFSLLLIHFVLKIENKIKNNVERTSVYL